MIIFSLLLLVFVLLIWGILYLVQGRLGIKMKILDKSTFPAYLIVWNEDDDGMYELYIRDSKGIFKKEYFYISHGKYKTGRAANKVLIKYDCGD